MSTVTGSGAGSSAAGGVGGAAGGAVGCGGEAGAWAREVGGAAEIARLNFLLGGGVGETPAEYLEYMDAYFH